MLKKIKKMISNLRKKNKGYVSKWMEDVNVYNNSVGGVQFFDMSPGGSTVRLGESSSSTISSNYYAVMNTDGHLEIQNGKDQRVEKKPVEVFEELNTEMPVFISDEKLVKSYIKLVERRINVLSKHTKNALHDERVTLAYLKCRLNYNMHKDLFKWATTNDTLVNQLCTKYKVKVVSFDGFYKNIPNEALDEIEKFSLAFDKVAPRIAPSFKLIVDDGGKEDKKDPILLAHSPFGKWYFVLGAWDKEVEIVDDVIYKGK